MLLIQNEPIETLDVESIAGAIMDRVGSQSVALGERMYPFTYDRFKTLGELMYVNVSGIFTGMGSDAFARLMKTTGIYINTVRRECRNRRKFQHNALCYADNHHLKQALGAIEVCRGYAQREVDEAETVEHRLYGLILGESITKIRNILMSEWHSHEDITALFETYLPDLYIYVERSDRAILDYHFMKVMGTVWRYIEMNMDAMCAYKQPVAQEDVFMTYVEMIRTVELLQRKVLTFK